MRFVAILDITTIESVYGVLQADKMVRGDERVVEEKLALPSYSEKPEMIVAGLT